MSDVICDFLSVTVPRERWSEVREGIVGPLDAVGASVDYDEGEDGALWRVGDGTVKAKRYGPVVSLGASGAVLAGLRALGAFGAYLSAIGAVPHKVTRLDAAHDVSEDTPPVLDRLVAKAASDAGLSLTRKRVLSRHVTRLVARREDGQDTGTCYIGSRNAEVRAAIYDKREERLGRGLADVGPLTRYELRLKSGVGATLHDAMDPEALFWHYMSPGVLDRPEGVREWVSNAEGFAVEWGDKPLPAALLVRRVQASADIADVVARARGLGPRGFDFLVGELRKLHDASGPSVD